jgi:hypothetical protein
MVLNPQPNPRRSGAGFPPRGKAFAIIVSPLGEIRKGVNLTAIRNCNIFIINPIYRAKYVLLLIADTHIYLY